MNTRLSHQLSRRTMLRVVGVGLLGSAVAACVPIQATPPTQPTPVVAANDEAMRKTVENFIGKLDDAGLFSGVALIARNGEILLNKAGGIADHTKKTPNTPQTIFRLGEMATQFTAAAALLLEQEQKLALQAPISTYLADSPQAWQEITLHHLLCHMSGIPDYINMADGYKALREGATPQQLLAIFHDMPLDFKPGEQRVFSHSGFVVAGLVIEQVSGQSYGDYLKAHIFDHLQMKDSGYGDPPQGAALNYSTSVSKEPVVFNPTALYAAGGCYSTSEDLFKWNEGLYNGLLLNQGQLKKMLTPYATFGDNNDIGSGYGINLGVQHNRKAVGNGGGNNGWGFSSDIHRFFDEKSFIDEKLTTLVLLNQEMDPFEMLTTLDGLVFQST